MMTSHRPGVEMLGALALTCLLKRPGRGLLHYSEVNDHSMDRTPDRPVLPCAICLTIYCSREWCSTATNQVGKKVKCRRDDESN